MEPGGWIMMLLSVGSVVALFVWCLWQVLFRAGPDTREHLHGGLDIDTQDSNDG